MECKKNIRLLSIMCIAILLLARCSSNMPATTYYLIQLDTLISEKIVPSAPNMKLELIGRRCGVLKNDKNEQHFKYRKKIFNRKYEYKITYVDTVWANEVCIIPYLNNQIQINSDSGFVFYDCHLAKSRYFLFFCDEEKRPDLFVQRENWSCSVPVKDGKTKSKHKNSPSLP